MPARFRAVERIIAPADGPVFDQPHILGLHFGPPRGVGTECGRQRCVFVAARNGSRRHRALARGGARAERSAERRGDEGDRDPSQPSPIVATKVE
jgi:hypothetical protein